MPSSIRDDCVTLLFARVPVASLRYFDIVRISLSFGFHYCQFQTRCVSKSRTGSNKGIPLSKCSSHVVKQGPDRPTAKMDGVSAAMQWLQHLLFGSSQGAQLLSVMVADAGLGGPPSLETIIILSTGLFLGSIAMVSTGIHEFHPAKTDRTWQWCPLPGLCWC